MTEYASIRVYTRERARYEGVELGSAIVSYLKSLKISARCAVFRGVEGCYENGETVASHIIDVAYDLPVMIDILLPQAEKAEVLSRLELMVTDGLVCVLPVEVTSFKAPSGLIPRNLLVRDIMTEGPIDGRADFPLRVVVDLLVDNRLKSLPIVDDGRSVVGIVTQGDLIKRAGMPTRFALFRTLPPEALSAWLDRVGGRAISEFMTSKPVVLRDQRSVGEAVRVMTREHLKRLPVVDSEGALCGMVSRIDILRALASAARETPGTPPPVGGAVITPHLVRDIILRDRLTVDPGTTLRTAVGQLACTEDDDLIVVDGDGHLLGLVTEEAILGAIEPGSVAGALLRRMTAHQSPEKTQVSEIMDREVPRVTEDTAVEEAIRLMTERGLKRIPVVDDQGRFTGLIRRDSILFALSRHL